MENKHENTFKIIKLILFILSITVLIILSVKLFPLFTNLGTSEGQAEFKEQIGNSSFGGVFMLLGLQLLQILVPVLPGEPIEFLSGMCYGTINGMLIIFIGAFLSSFIIFYLVKKFVKNFINTFFGKDKIEKLENSKWLSNPDRIELFLIIVFLIPGTPKDLFVYIAGLLPIKPSHFFAISTFCRFPSVISSTFAGSTLVDGNWKLSIITYAITFLITGISIVIYRYIKMTHFKKTNE